MTPTTSIYSQIQAALNIENINFFSLLAVASAPIGVLIVFLIKWNSRTNKEVKRKTEELMESERRSNDLEQSYETMKAYLDEVLQEVGKSK